MSTTTDGGAVEEAGVGPAEQPQASAPVGHEGTRVDIDETRAWAANGFLALLVALLLVLGGVALGVFAVGDLAGQRWGFGSGGGLAGGIVLFLLGLLVLSSVTIVAPGQTKVLQFFGRYVGTNRRTGLTMVMPLTTKRSVSVRVHNFETSSLKVNDADGNPVEIGAIIVWQVADTARACFSVEDYESFVRVQAEAALRHVATTHPYDEFGEGGTSLRGSTDVVSRELAFEVAERVVVAGVEIVEVRISHLAYAPEIAQAMLQRQQAGAIVAARARIVEGAVGMVEMALAKLEAESIVELDDERRAAMVSNLLVVLCGESKASPVINTGSLYT
ncbi:SPFH domain-containing protein [Mobilicoccus caccae]|uniref:Membrane protease subunit n=1 Tax=Mobilicoccus caccae TaxID=1859295 RepID=A0ABQ6IRQ6_9MICO|nr:SPFH domain-containing protein [Mobilicoccus caccae]GMA40020.1 membrane protease subunit [Mobilicoccus caccae]